MPAGWMIGLRIRVPDRTCIIIRGIFSDIETIALHFETETATKGSRIYSKCVRSDVASCVATTEGGGVGTTRSSVQSEAAVAETIPVWDGAF